MGVLTREPDTASTVGGKDAHMGYQCIALHLDGFAMRYILFYGGISDGNQCNEIPFAYPGPV